MERKRAAEDQPDAGCEEEQSPPSKRACVVSHLQSTLSTLQHSLSGAFSSVASNMERTLSTMSAFNDSMEQLLLHCASFTASPRLHAQPPHLSFVWRCSGRLPVPASTSSRIRYTGAWCQQELPLQETLRDGVTQEHCVPVCAAPEDLRVTPKLFLESPGTGAEITRELEPFVWPLFKMFSSSSSSSSSEATDSPPVFSEGSRLVVRTQRLRDLLDLPPSAGVMPGEVRLVHLQPRPGLVAHVCVRSIDDGAGTCEADVETSEPKWTAALHCSLLAPQ